MKTYIASQGRTIHKNGLMGCLTWSAQQIELDPAPIKILKARAGESNATVIAEVIPGSIRFIADGRIVPTKALKNG